MTTLKKISLEPKTIENAEPLASEVLAGVKKNYGMIPNLYTRWAHNPAILDAYTHGLNSFRKNAGFTPAEQEVLFMAISFENSCEYCMTIHSTMGTKLFKVPTDVVEALRNGTEVPDEKLRALSTFAKIVNEKRGYPTQEEVDDFLNTGYTQEHILGVITAIGLKTISNYSNHIFEVPVEDAFKSNVWRKKQ